MNPFGAGLIADSHGGTGPPPPVAAGLLTAATATPAPSPAMARATTPATIGRPFSFIQGTFIKDPSAHEMAWRIHGQRTRSPRQPGELPQPAESAAGPPRPGGPRDGIVPAGALGMVRPGDGAAPPAADHGP